MKWTQLKRSHKLGLFIAITLVVSTILLELFEKRFDQTDWANEPLQRYEMVDDLIESQLLLNKPEAEVLQLLGEPYLKINNDQNGFVYKLGTPPSFFGSEEEQLLIVFENGWVEKVTLVTE